MSKPSAFEYARMAVEAEERLLEILTGETREGTTLKEEYDPCRSEDEAEDDT